VMPSGDVRVQPRSSPNFFGGSNLTYW
jgi:hypothetical protein